MDGSVVGVGKKTVLYMHTMLCSGTVLYKALIGEHLRDTPRITSGMSVPPGASYSGSHTDALRLEDGDHPTH
jgi:hypothetical protein